MQKMIVVSWIKQSDAQMNKQAYCLSCEKDFLKNTFYSSIIHIFAELFVWCPHKLPCLIFFSLHMSFKKNSAIDMECFVKICPVDGFPCFCHTRSFMI